jgi:thiol-disulfide isomerase/thioredoxin
MHTLANYLRGIWNDPFKRYVSLGLLVVAAIMLFVGSPDTGFEEPAPPPDEETTLEVHFFYHSGCPHCRDQEPFNEELAAKYPDVYFVYHDGADPGEYDVLVSLIEGTGVTEEELDFPATVIGKRVFIGWVSREVSGPPIEQAIIDYLAGGEQSQQTEDEEVTDELDLPVFGTIRISEYSLPALAVVLGLVDGFNPCAMWVLAYLISLLFVLNDRRKAWLLVGSFVLASGILYYLFMTAWLNAFLLLGYSRPVTVIVGAVALGAGIFNIREYIQSGGQIVCEVIDADSRKSTMSRIQSVVASPLNVATVLAIIALAFVVNSIEFVCSSALPAIFTQVLALAQLSTLQHYLYILLYDFFFMLDDLIIFGAAAFAMNTTLGDRYAKYCRPIGGVILGILGVLLLFAPQLLR